MHQKYVIHIEGKELTISDAPLADAEALHKLVLRVDDGAEIAPALELMLQNGALCGLHLICSDPDRCMAQVATLFVPVQAAGGAVDDGQGQLLAIRRLGRWDLPKGKVDPGEPIRDAALREVREECGSQALQNLGWLCATWHVYERGGKRHLKRTDWYHMRGDRNEVLVPQAEEDITEVIWLDAAGVSALKEDTYPSILSVVQAWEATLPGTGRPVVAMP